MPSTYTSDWMEVESGLTTNYQVPDSHNIIGTEVRFRGITVESTETKKRYNKSRYDGPLEYYADKPSETADISVGTPSYPPDASEDKYARLDLRDDFEGTATIEYSATNSSGEFNQRESGIIIEGIELYDYNQYVEVTVSPYAREGRSGSTGHNASAEIVLQYNASSTERSDPQTTLGEGTVDFPTLDDGETTSWSSIDGFATGANEFSHTIGGSAIADFQFRYTYTENASVPIGVSAGTLGATITEETVVAGRVPAAATTLDSLPDFSDQSGWLARLTKLDGTTETFGEKRLMGIDTNQEHTAAWGGTIDLPPIIDPDAYRGGAMELRYDGALILRCPTLIDRDEADDGTITIKGVGPASELKASPVDRDFRSVLATDAMRTLLTDDADVPGPQVTIHDPPDRPVTDQTVQSATAREEFAQFLSGRSRDSSSGQFAVESGAADGWPDTAPFEWAGGGIGVTKTLRFVEAEDGTLGSGMSPSAASGASGGSVVRFAAAGDEATYAASFEHEIPEGAFGVAIRAKPESTGDTGTTTFRARVDDEELLSAPASDFGAAGTGFSWVRTTVAFQPGTGAFDLTLDLTQSGALQLDVDAIALYDDRYSYDFDNSTDANDALDGPQLYPDAAALEFEPAPAGIVLDSATATATVDAAGVASTIGLRGPDGTGSASSIAGTSDSHTASFSGTVSGVRPVVELSRYADGRAETPTSGNAGQTLQSIQTTISGNAIPVIEQRGFAETTAFDAVQTLCRDYDFNWVVEHGNERGTFRIEIFKRGDPALRRQLPAETVVTDYSESAAAENYKNEITVVGDRIPNGGGERYRWTESAEGEIDEFGREPLRIENDDLESTNDCRVVARSELAKRLDEDDRGGSLDIVPTTVLEPGYPYEVVAWEDNPDAPSWGESWGESWGGVQEEFATLETATFSESAGDVSAGGDFTVRSDLLAALSGGN